MPDVVVLLQLEHHKMRKLLGLIQQQATNISLRAPVNIRLLKIAFEYLSDYPDQCHHPKEDVLFRKLASRFPDLVKSLKNLLEEHEKLADWTRKLRQIITESQLDRSKLNEGLAEQLRVFLEFYDHHMYMEEQHFFPIVLKRLSRDDFAEIDFTLFDKPDPLFNQEAERKFAELNDEITRLGIDDKVNADQREETALLATIVDVATFNETMQRISEPVSLIGSSAGEYDLMRMGNLLVHIPACSESRAAWCAYFYWKAATKRGSS